MYTHTDICKVSCRHVFFWRDIASTPRYIPELTHHLMRPRTETKNLLRLSLSLSLSLSQQSKHQHSHATAHSFSLRSSEQKFVSNCVTHKMWACAIGSKGDSPSALLCFGVFWSVTGVLLVNTAFHIRDFTSVPGVIAFLLSGDAFSTQPRPFQRFVYH